MAAGWPRSAQMHREFFQNVWERKPSPLRPEVALELSKIAYAAKMSIAEGRDGQGLLVSAIVGQA